MAEEIRRRGLLVGALVVGLTAAGCRRGGAPAAGAGPGASGSAGAPPEIDGPSEADARRALRAWAAFPVSATPRPVVLLGSAVLDPAGGVPDAVDRAAYLAGALDLPATLPAGPDRAAGWPLVDARQAAALLRSRPGRPAGRTRLPVTRVAFGSAVFSTDRGSRQLPAWLFSLRGVRQPAAVLAVSPAARFAPRLPAGTPRYDPVRAITVGPDGRTVLVGLAAAPAGSPACEAGYAVRAVESPQAVALRIGVPRRDEAASPEPFCDDATYHRAASVQLASPLGARVLVSARNTTALVAATGG